MIDKKQSNPSINKQDSTSESDKNLFGFFALLHKVSLREKAAVKTQQQTNNCNTLHPSLAKSWCNKATHEDND